nr:MAG TPA: hypothetical protein [Caudoviricetes sp.]DAK81057.1 MAG TPA: hypothetical protein [Caudoviricetes sp.]DAL90664.1 MAG TPA: hypothetical protein [Caudoviricetes sp.]DAU31434.1 MAG TPA: hypothetical protein [Caudoviricetes sp.]
MHTCQAQFVHFFVYFNTRCVYNMLKDIRRY